MLEILGKLDPAGTGFVMGVTLVNAMAKRVRARVLKMNPCAPDPRQKWQRMIARGIRAELYKLNVYSGPSGLFKPHVDTPRSQMQIGSLVIGLPVQFDGGALAVRHQQEQVEYDWSHSLSADEQPSVQ
jgi:hypothetical protein